MTWVCAKNRTEHLVRKYLFCWLLKPANRVATVVLSVMCVSVSFHRRGSYHIMVDSHPSLVEGLTPGLSLSVQSPRPGPTHPHPGPQKGQHLTEMPPYFTCGMMVSLDLRSCSPIVSIFIPSMLISPPAASVMRNKDNVMEDLPAPVLPTIPIWKQK